MKFTRSISHDLFLAKEREKQYKKHVEAIGELNSHRTDREYAKISKEKQKISKTMKKAKEQARNFKLKEEHL